MSRYVLSQRYPNRLHEKLLSSMKLAPVPLILVGVISLGACGKAGPAPKPTPTHIPAPMGIVTGGIAPCVGAIFPRMHLPRYAAGTVTVLKGRFREKKIGPGTFADVFPRQVAARVAVRKNSKYRLVLPPGHYVLKASYPHGNVHPFIGVNVRVGKTVHADIPDMCK